MSFDQGDEVLKSSLISLTEELVFDEDGPCKVVESLYISYFLIAIGKSNENSLESFLFERDSDKEVESR
jgi:hypothetical protein